MPHAPSLTVIVAATLSNGIGQSSRLPWRLPLEMAYFSRVTSKAPDQTRNAVIMGRNTWESIPLKFRPLPKRLNIIISRNENYPLLHKSDETEARLSTSLQNALSQVAVSAQIHRCFIIGGASLYGEVLGVGSAVSGIALANRILLTRILHPTFDDCDVYMPEFRDLKTPEGQAMWRQASHEELRIWAGDDVPEGVQEEKGIQYEFQMWIRTP